MIGSTTLLTNICLEPYWRTCIKDRFSCLFSDIQLKSVLYEEYRDNTHGIRLSNTIVICLNFDEFYPNLLNDISSGVITYETIENDCLQKCKDIYSYIKSNSNAHVIWFGFEDYYCIQMRSYGALLSFEGLVDRLNLALSEMLEGDTFIDFKRLIADVGIKNAYNIKGKYRWNAPYSRELINLMVDEIYKQHLIITGNTKKCLVLDCDNVLWGGVLSEDGGEGIKVGNSGLGRPFQDFQRYLLDLYYHGVILAVSSKNDEVDVLRVFREHTGMILKEEHIASFMCNWNNKPDNIRKIAKVLNIGLDSIVFIDDSVFEINAINMILPEVTTVLYQRDAVYGQLSCFNLKHTTDLKTVKERTCTYKTNRQRVELQENLSSYEDYILSLEMVVNIHRTTNYELVRISELTQRTNKCTNGARYTLDQIKCINEDEQYELYTVSLSDKFSDLGIVGVIGLKGQCADIFSLSCRALGRRIEDRMICWLLEKRISAIRFRPTNKNEQLCNLLKYYGIRLEDAEMSFA